MSKKMAMFSFIIVILLLVGCTGTPKTGSVALLIVDDDTNNLITRQITFTVDNRSPYIFTGGSYEITGLSEGSHSYKAVANGYETTNGNLEVKGGTTISYELRMRCVER